MASKTILVIVKKAIKAMENIVKVSKYSNTILYSKDTYFLEGEIKGDYFC